jgi:hypothetical protein
VPVDTSAGVSLAIPDPDVESGAALLPYARRADPLHYGGGRVLLDWAPVSGCAPTGGAGVTKGPDPDNRWAEILFRSELHVRDGCEYWVDRCPGASLYSSDDCESIWVTSDPADHWGPVFGDGESVGRRAVRLGAYTTREDGGAVGPLPVHRYGGFCLWVHPGGLVSGEGADVAPEDSIGCAWGARAATEAVVERVATSWWWRGWSLFYCRGGAGLAVDAAGDTLVSLCWG